MVEVLLPSIVSSHWHRRSSIADCIMAATTLPSTTIVQQQDAINDTTRSPSPSDESLLVDRVQQQVEWYFSDENLRKDAFLMKHIARNKSGFVSLKLVASLRKIKSLTKECSLVADSIRASQHLELNEDSTKVRRLQPVPSVDYTGIPKTIIITNYTTGTNDDDIALSAEQEYSRYGKIASVLVLQPGKAVPLHIKSCKSRFPSIGKETCVLVEYDTTEMAKHAYRECKNSWRQTATVQLLSQKQDSDADKQTIKRSGPIKPNSPTAAESNTTRSRTTRQSRSPTSCSPPPAVVRRFVNDKASTTGPTVRLVAVLRTPLGPDGSKGFKSRR